MGAVFGFHFIIGKEMESEQSTTVRMSCCDMILWLKIDLAKSAIADISLMLSWHCRVVGPPHNNSTKCSEYSP